MALRRKSVPCVALPTVGGALGAEYSNAQMHTFWESMRLGHKHGRQQTDVRALVLYADLFPLNLAKHGANASMNEHIAVDAERT